MIVRQQPNGVHLMDAEALAVLTGRLVATIRAHCAAVRTVRGEPVYDAELSCLALAGVKDQEAITAAEAGQRLGIPPGTVRSWASRGHLAVYARELDGRPLYRTTDIMQIKRAPTSANA